MKVIRPTKNPITGKYTDTHRGYDFAGLNLPDELVAGKDGTVIESVNLYNTNWINNGVLITKDYGNYLIIKHDYGTYELHAHLKKDSLLPVGKKVKAGEFIARIGNTGNSTGPHVHSEYRDMANRNIQVEFIDTMENNPLTECLRLHREAVDKLNGQDKKILDLQATEKRLQKEKEQVRREGEQKLLTQEVEIKAECEIKCQELREEHKTIQDMWVAQRDEYQKKIKELEEKPPVEVEKIIYRRPTYRKLEWLAVFIEAVNK